MDKVELAKLIAALYSALSDMSDYSVPDRRRRCICFQNPCCMIWCAADRVTFRRSITPTSV